MTLPAPGVCIVTMSVSAHKKEFWIPAAARITMALSRPHMRMKMAYFHLTDALVKATREDGFRESEYRSSALV